MSALDPTLSQILSELYTASRERDQYREVLEKINAKLDDADYLVGRLNEVRSAAGLPVLMVPDDRPPADSGNLTEVA